MRKLIKKASKYLHHTCHQEENLALVEEALATPLFEQQQPNPMFTKESLVKLPDHHWMIDLEMVQVEQGKYPSLMEDLLPELEKQASVVPDQVCTKDLKVLSLDLETTGFDRTLCSYGGQVEAPTKIVGICVAVNQKTGYYIPVLHNQADGIANYPWDEVKQFLEATQRFFCIYHNAFYDREIMEANTIALNKEYACTHLMAVNMHYKVIYFTTGLKKLSEVLLGRKMLEIADLGDGFVPLIYQPTSNITCYGCSDALNTLSLFHLFLADKEKNPYKVNPFAMKLDIMANDCTRWMLRHGAPLDYKHLGGSIRTMIRRRMLIEAKFAEHYTTEIGLGSDEKLGQLIGQKLLDAYKPTYPNLPESVIFTKFADLANFHFKMDVKRKMLKSGKEKITYSCGADILAELKVVDKKGLKWVDESLADWLKNLVPIIENYRSLVHDIGLLLSLYRHAYVDDTNKIRSAIGLRFNGTITNRYSNEKSKGSLERYQITHMATKTKVKHVNPDVACGLNIQGVNSDPISLMNAKKVVKAPEGFFEQFQALTDKVEVELRETLLQL